MPIYTYRCALGHRFEKSNTISNRKVAVCECGEPGSIVITPVEIQAQILGGSSTPGYLCPVTDEYVTSRKRRREILKEHNLIEMGDKTSSNHRDRMIENTNGTGVST